MAIQNKILLVDDDPMNISILEEILLPDYEIAVATNGDEALEILPNFEPDLILLDIMMPGIDGYEVCKRIREDTTHAMTKIILVSGKSMVEERLQGYDVGADDYIVKPFVDEELVAKVKVFLRLKRAEEVDSIKNDLLKLFSHETRTPLNGIIGIGNMLVDDLAIPEEQRGNIGLMVQCGYQLLDFVEKTKMICTLKTDTGIDKGQIDLAKIMSEVLSGLEEYRIKNESKISVSIPEDISLYGDWEYVPKVFSFLLHNAIKFSEKGSEIGIIVNDLPEETVVSVKDSGCGVLDKNKQKVFDEFSISDIMHHNKGQGLSLAISKYVMHAHGGTIEVTDNCGSGSVFTLRFPKVVTGVIEQV